MNIQDRLTKKKTKTKKLKVSVSLFFVIDSRLRNKLTQL